MKELTRMGMNYEKEWNEDGSVNEDEHQSDEHPSNNE